MARERKRTSDSTCNPDIFLRLRASQHTSLLASRGVGAPRSSRSARRVGGERSARVGFGGHGGARAKRLSLDGALTREEAERAARELLADPVSEVHRLRRTDGAPFPNETGNHRIDVIRKPRVMDPVAGSVILALRNLGISAARAATFRVLELSADASAELLRRAAGKTLANETIEDLLVDDPNLPLPSSRPPRRCERSRFRCARWRGRSW